MIGLSPTRPGSLPGQPPVEVPAAIERGSPDRAVLALHRLGCRHVFLIPARGFDHFRAKLAQALLARRTHQQHVLRLVHHQTCGEDRVAHLLHRRHSA
jgi:hypothetical protein